ncbi:MAG: hypothetical protein GX591_02375 [Planctomycetes bacterium]|nr:hypothetical protein [Planctomycetota bacterium]
MDETKTGPRRSIKGVMHQLRAELAELRRDVSSLRAAVRSRGIVAPEPLPEAVRGAITMLRRGPDYSEDFARTGGLSAADAGKWLKPVIDRLERALPQGDAAGGPACVLGPGGDYAKPWPPAHRVDTTA